MSFVISSQFELGNVVVTRAIDEKYMKNTQGRILICDLLERHANKDDGDLCSEDKQLNIDAHEHGGRIFSLYETKDDETIYIITEHDRSVTTILFNFDY